MADGGRYRHFTGCNNFIFILAMNIANKIKTETIPLSVERGVMAAEYCVKWKLIEWDRVWCCEYTFIDGSTIVHRGYCD